MNLMRRTHANPYALRVADPFAGFDALFDSLMPAMRQRANDAALLMPPTDIHELKDAWEVTTELPGVRKEDVRVSLHDGVLAIEAVSRSAREEKDGEAALRRERRYGTYMRRFVLGQDVQEDKVEATFENGVLTLRIPKAIPAVVEPRQIPIR